MDWISFAWGVGAIIFINIVYTIFVLPKKLKQIAELENRSSELTNELESKLESIISEHEEMMISLEKDNDKVKLALETLQSSIKLMKTCPACGVEFPLYVLEEKK